MPQLSRLIFGLSFVALVLAGCGHRPLYGTSSNGDSVSVDLAGVSVEQQKTRAGQLVRNELLSGMGSDGSRYVLKLQSDEKTTQVSEIVGQNVTRQRYRLNVKYALVDTASGGAATQGGSFSSVSFDTIEEPVADLQAADTARSRAAREVAEDIRIRLAAYFAQKR